MAAASEPQGSQVRGQFPGGLYRGQASGRLHGKLAECGEPELTVIPGQNPGGRWRQIPRSWARSEGQTDGQCGSSPTYRIAFQRMHNLIGNLVREPSAQTLVEDFSYSSMALQLLPLTAGRRSAAANHCRRRSL